MSTVICSGFFHIFQNIPLKYSSFYTYQQIILQRLYRKNIQQNFFRWKGHLWDSYNKPIWAQKSTINKFTIILNKWLNTEKLLFSLLDHLTLNANFKWQPLNFLVILIFSLILHLMLILISVNYFYIPMSSLIQ